jgi:calcium-dependent protein kinase
VESLLDFNPKKRPTAQDALFHKWIKSPPSVKKSNNKFWEFNPMK